MCIGNGRRRAKADLTRAAAVYRKILKLGSSPDCSSSGGAAVPLGGAARIKLAAAGKLETFWGLENGRRQLQTGRKKIEIQIKMMISNTSVRGEKRFSYGERFWFSCSCQFLPREENYEAVSAGAGHLNTFSRQTSFELQISVSPPSFDFTGVQRRSSCHRVLTNP